MTSIEGTYNLLQKGEKWYTLNVKRKEKANLYVRRVPIRLLNRLSMNIQLVIFHFYVRITR